MRAWAAERGAAARYPASSSASAKSDEKAQDAVAEQPVAADGADEKALAPAGGFMQRVTAQLARWGLETNGCVLRASCSPAAGGRGCVLTREDGGIRCRITPIPEEERTDRRLYQFFFVWFSANANILTCVCAAGLTFATFWGR